MQSLKIAYRNCWRNKRRTFITAGSIMISLCAALLIRSLQVGTYAAMVNESIGKFSGLLQVQHPDYFYEPSLDNALYLQDSLQDRLSKLPGIAAVAPRITTVGLASSGQKSRPVMVSAFDTKREESMQHPEHLLIQYRINKKAFKVLKNQLKLQPEQEKRLSKLQGRAYHKLDFLYADLQLSTAQIKTYASLFEHYCRVDGENLTPNDTGVWITDRLSSYLQVTVGDTLVLLGQGYHGASAAGLFPIRGCIKSPNVQLANKLVYMTLPTAQKWLDLQGHISYLAINLENQKEMLTVQKSLNAQLDSTQYSARNWQELTPSLHHAIKGDEQSGIAIIGIVYLIIFFGIVGTTLMMINERKREFTMLYALGMPKNKMIRTLLLEMLLIGCLGIIAALIIALPLIAYFTSHPIVLTGSTAKAYEEMGFAPIMPAGGMGNYIFSQLLVVLTMLLLACYIPLRQIRKLQATSK